MGLFDWLFGKKKDPYQTGPRNPSRSSAEQPWNHQAQGPAQQPPYIRPSGDSGQAAQNLRTSYLSFRRKRSAKPLDAVRDKPLRGGRNPQTGEAGPVGAIGTIGGTPHFPDPHYDVRKIRSLDLPDVPHADALAELLGIHRNTLVWLAARPFYGHDGALLSHYTLCEIPKPSGGRRLLAIPLPELKSAQRALHRKLLTHLPVHAAAHGFRKGHDAMTGAAIHVRKPVVICMDIADFFPSFTFRRVSGYFRNLGYGRGIAVALANLTTERLCWARLKDTKGRWIPPKGGEDWARSIHPELPQGAPTSPGIANAIVWRMDKRLTALARKFGGDYSRYADDLTFSGFEKMAKHAKLIVALVEKIVHTEGLAINKKKTRIMRKGRRQKVTGVVVNKQTNLSRRDFDLLKAILHNCIKKGPSTQNRSNHPNFKEHLRGRVAHALHIGPERGAKLKKLFDAIDWSR